MKYTGKKTRNTRDSKQGAHENEKQKQRRNNTKGT